MKTNKEYNKTEFEITKISVYSFAVACFIIVVFSLTGEFGELAQKIAAGVTLVPCIVFMVLYTMKFKSISKEMDEFEEDEEDFC